MSYDLAAWSGPRPRNDSEAAEEYERRCAYMEDDEAELASATPVVAAFLAELLSRHPALGQAGDEQSPWATGPEPGDVNGDFVYLTMVYGTPQATYDDVVVIAHRHGLVVYDPQLDALV